MKEIEGRNGGTLKIPEKGDPSPNPAGKPKGKTISTILSELLEKEVIDEEDGAKRTRAEIIALRLVKKAKSTKIDAQALKAIEQILDRTEGKAKQTVDVKSNIYLTDRPINFE